MKKVRKIVPVSLYDIPGLEKWLEDQADEGLFPTHLGSLAVFTPDGKPGTRFRLDAFGAEKDSPSEERLALYREAGWEYAFPIGKAYFLFYATDPDAPELYSDYQSRGLSLDRLTRRMRSARRKEIFSIVLLLALVTCPFWLNIQSKFDVQPDRWAGLPAFLLQLCPVYLLLFLPLFICICRRELQDWHTIRDLHKNLSQGLPPPPSPGPSKKIVWENRMSLILIVPLLLCLAVSLFDLNRVPIERFPLPYIDLQELEGQPLVYQNRTSFRPDLNTGELRCSLLAPVWYEISQDMESPTPGTLGYAHSPDPEGGKYTYAPDLNMEYCHVLFPGMARTVARSLLHEMRLVNIHWVYEEVDHPGLDYVLLARDEDSPWQMAALVKGGKIAVFRYAGVLDLGEELDRLAVMVR